MNIGTTLKRYLPGIAFVLFAAFGIGLLRLTLSGEDTVTTSRSTVPTETLVSVPSPPSTGPSGAPSTSSPPTTPSQVTTIPILDGASNTGPQVRQPDTVPPAESDSSTVASSEAVPSAITPDQQAVIDLAESFTRAYYTIPAGETFEEWAVRICTDVCSQQFYKSLFDEPFVFDPEVSELGVVTPLEELSGPYQDGYAELNVTVDVTKYVSNVATQQGRLYPTVRMYRHEGRWYVIGFYT